MRPPRRNPHGALLGALLLVACGGGAAQPDTADTTSSTASPDGATAGISATNGVTTGITATDAATSAATASAATTSATDATTIDASTTGTATADASTTGGPPPDMPRPDACEPTTCRAAGATCGVILDGCGDELDCGRCTAPDTCGGGGVDNVCGQACVPVRMLFFDLGDTLVESDGGDQFVERPGVSEMITELKALGMRVGIITNVPEGYTMQDLEDLLVDPGLLDAFELVVLSSEATAPKPDPAIYTEAHALLMNPPPIGEVAYVSENLAEIADQAVMPTQGARAAGMLGVHLSPAPPSPLADYTIALEPPDALVALAETEWLPCSDP